MRVIKIKAMGKQTMFFSLNNQIKVHYNNQTAKNNYNSQGQKYNKMLKTHT